MPPIPAAAFGVNAADIAGVDRQATMHPLSALETPARLTGASDEVGNIGYIPAREHRDSPFRSSIRWRRSTAGGRLSCPAATP